MNKNTLLGVVALGILLGLVAVLMPLDSSHNPGHPSANLISSDQPEGGDFRLTSVDGPVALSDFKDKLVLIYFGYTFCPDICPTNLGNLSVAYRDFTEEERAKLQILFVSVDPERDTPERLKQYADYFESNIIGITGDLHTITDIARRYGVVFVKVDDPDNGTNYAVDHSAFTYVVDQQGQWREQIPHATSPDGFAKIVRSYLAQ